MQHESREDVIVDIDPSALLPNPYQVRCLADASDSSFDELVESIRKSGLIEFPVIRQTENGYQIATGHMRVAACVKLGLKSVKCVVRPLTDEQMAEVVLEENLKRNSLNPIQEARGYANLRDKFHWSEERIAARFQKTRDIIAQRLRLLTFQEPIQDLVLKGQLTPSHAEAIATAPAPRQLQLARIAVDKRLTVKRTTEMAKEFADIESANQEALENIGPRLGMISTQLAGLNQQIARHESLLAWFEFHNHTWKAETCKHNNSGVCYRFSWKAEPAWTTRLGGAVRFVRSTDGSWRVEACGAVCAYCTVYETRTLAASTTNAVPTQ
jgi:ParB/RepB/Spo0J family partition protein